MVAVANNTNSSFMISPSSTGGARRKAGANSGHDVVAAKRFFQQRGIGGVSAVGQRGDLRQEQLEVFEQASRVGRLDVGAAEQQPRSREQVAAALGAVGALAAG